ncbi:hypothetical protein HZB88_04630 [archaeon]|nr:hypothetical protein [archaeon]
MEIKSGVRFGDEKVKKAYLQLDTKTFQEKELKKWLDKAFHELEHNAFCGIQLPKRLISKDYFSRFGRIDNLWKYNMPNAWRLIYTVKKEEIIVISIILEWLEHKTYERRFNY